MKKSIKIALTSIAIALAASSSFAQDSKIVELENGASVKVEGESVFVLGADGSATPAPDGTHVAKDGSSIVTKDGKIAN